MTTELLVWENDFQFHIISNKQKICNNSKVSPVYSFSFSWGFLTLGFYRGWKAPPFNLDPNPSIAYFLPHLLPLSSSLYILPYVAYLYITHYIYIYDKNIFMKLFQVSQRFQVPLSLNTSV